ncbi:MAG: FAD-dependent oxidoreductase [Candidatus Paceibacterota bacterium]|jgi:alkyl hydroperoxide reductase subunit F
MYDLIIIGGGPGGVSAGIYAARKKIKALLITETFGGQSLVSADIQNWIGTKSISGFDLAKSLEEHLKAQEGIEILEGDLVDSISKKDSGFEIKTKAGKSFETKYILVASGSRRRKLGVPGEAEHDGKGVAYCSICDAPLFNGKEVAVIGGGNAGLEAVIDLFPYASKIYLLEFSDALKGDPVTQEKIKSNPKIEIIFGAKTLEIIGDTNVSSLKYLDQKNNEEKTLAVQGVFIEVGIAPNSEFMKGLVNINNFDEITVDPKTYQTSSPGIWAVGDVTDSLYKQNNISVGEAVTATLNIYEKITKS